MGYLADNYHVEKSSDGGNVLVSGGANAQPATSGKNFFNDFLARGGGNASGVNAFLNNKPAEEQASENARNIAEEQASENAKRMAVQGDARKQLEQRRTDLQKQLDDLNNGVNTIYDRLPQQEASLQKDMKRSELQYAIEDIDRQLAKEYGNEERIGDTLKGWWNSTKGAYKMAAATAQDFAKQNESRVNRDVEYTGISNDFSQPFKGLSVEERGLNNTDKTVDLALPKNEKLESAFNGAIKWRDSAMEDIAKGTQQKQEAKEGTGAVGGFLLDALSTGLDIGADTALSLIPGMQGAGLYSMATRVFGNAAAESAANGDDVETQIAKGVTAALIESLTEKIGGGFDKAYGSTISKAIAQKFGKNAATAATKVVNANGAAIMTLLKESGSEALEEALSDVLNIVAERLFGWSGDERTFLEELSDSKSEILYDALLGGFVGMFGATGEAINTKQSAETRNKAIADGVDAAIQNKQNVNNEQAENIGSAEQATKTPADMLFEAARPTTAETHAETNSETQPAAPLQTDSPAPQPTSVNNVPVTNVVSGDVNSQPAQQNAPQTATELLKSYVGSNKQSNVGTDRFGFTGERVNTQDVIRDMMYSEEGKAERGLTENETAHIRHSDIEVDSKAKERISANEAQALNDILNKKTEEWTDVDSAVSKLLTDKYEETASEAMSRGDNEAAAKAYKTIADITLARESKVSEAGRILRQQSRLSTTTDIVSEAASILYGENKPTENGKEPTKLRNIPVSKKNSVMSDVKRYAETLKNIPEGDTTSLINLINTVATKRRTTSLFSEKTSKAFNSAINRIAESTDGETFLRQLADVQIRSIASDYVKPGIKDQLKAWRFLAVLSSPKTANTNLSSNFILGSVLETVSNNAALLPDTIASWFTKTREVGADKSVFNSAYWQGLTDAALKSYVQVYLDAEIGDGGSSYLENTGRTFKAIGNPLERVFSILQRNQSFLLTTTDEAAKGATMAQSRQALSALAEKGKVKAENIGALAERDALYRVLQLDNKVTETILGMRKAADKLLGLGSNVMMFARIPVNAVMTTIDYIPTTGVFKGLFQSVKLAYDIRNNTVKPGQQAEAAKSFGRAATGASLVLASMFLAAKGIIKDYDDEDKDVVSQNKTEGKIGTQINMSAFGRMISGKDSNEQQGDIWLNLSWMPILNGLATLGEDLNDTYGDDFKIWNVFDESANFDAVASAFMEFPAVSTISSTWNAFKYSDKEDNYGRSKDAAISFAYQVGQSYLIPNIIKQIASGVDSKERDFRSDTQEGQYINNFKGGVPGLRNTLPVKLDNYGNEVTNMGGVLNFLNKTFIPGGLVSHNTPEVSSLLNKYAEKSGDTSIIPDRHAPYKHTFKDLSGNEIEYKLTVADKRAYEQLRGGIIDNFVLSASNNDYFKTLSDDMQIEIIKEIESFANNQAKTQLEMQLGYDLSKDKDRTIASLSNVPLYFITDKIFSTLGGTNPQYTTVDSIIKNFDNLPQDIQNTLYGSVNNLATMRYANDVKNVGSKRFYEIKTETTRLAKEKFNGSTSSAIEAVAIAKNIKGSDNDKLVALELVNLPDKETGKRASIVRRIETANTEGISFDQWTALEAKVWDNIKARNGSSASKKDIYSAAQDLGMNDYLCYRIWNKYSADEDNIQVYDDYFSKDYVGFEYPSLYEEYTNTPNTGADLLLDSANSQSKTRDKELLDFLVDFTGRGNVW